MTEMFTYIKGVNEVQEGIFFYMKLRSRRRGNDLKLAGGK